MATPITNTSVLPTVDRAALPEDIRKASKEDQQTYRAALGFEQALMSELLRSVDMLKGSSEDGAPSAYADMIPTTLAQAVSSGGGLGLARSLYESMRSEK
jgi:Rod binding domain-containing protein